MGVQLLRAEENSAGAQVPRRAVRSTVREPETSVVSPKEGEKQRNNTRTREMRDARVDEEVAGLLDPAARSSRRSTDTTYGVVKGITACLVLVSAAALVLVRLPPFSRSVTLSRGRRCGERVRPSPPATGHPERRTAEARRASDARHARATPRELSDPFRSPFALSSRPARAHAPCRTFSPSSLPRRAGSRRRPRPLRVSPRVSPRVVQERAVLGDVVRPRAVHRRHVVPAEPERPRQD